MKKIFLTLLYIAILGIAIDAQTLTTIGGRCPSPNQGSFGTINYFGASGNLVHQPCSVGASIFLGAVDFSGATITGVVTGSGTTNFIPRWTAASALGNTPMSWNNTFYVMNNTALNAEFNLALTPSSTVGVFSVGDFTTTPTTFWTLTQSTNTSQLNGTTLNNVVTGNWVATESTGDFGTTLNAAGKTWVTTNGLNSVVFNINGTANTIGAKAVSGITLDTVTSGFTVGDINTLGSGTRFKLDASTGAFTFSDDNDFATSFMAAAADIELGDVFGAGNRTKFTIDDVNNEYVFAANNTGNFNLAEIISYSLFRTITAGGTTGNQTINKPAGTVNFAIAATDITVTNSTVSATSLIFCTVQSLDATAISCRVTDKATGSFHIRIPAATAETSVAFWVLN